MTPDFSVVTEFEKRIAEFFGAPYAVAADSATHGIELCLRMIKADHIMCPSRTYLSIPMLANKLNLPLIWHGYEWDEYYGVLNYYLPDTQRMVYDAAVYWKKDGYIPGSLMSISFQYQKHLSLGRGGMILCDNKEAATQLKKMSYDGRLPGIPWRDQNVSTMGYHYYMTPDTAALGLQKLPDAILTVPRKWAMSDWPDLTEMDVFKK